MFKISCRALFQGRDCTLSGAIRAHYSEMVTLLAMMVMMVIVVMGVLIILKQIFNSVLKRLLNKKNNSKRG